MTNAQIIRLMNFLNGLTVDQMEEVRRLVTNLVGIARSKQVLTGTQERPGKRGKQWKKNK